MNPARFLVAAALAACAALFCACAAHSPALAPDSTAYYYGRSLSFSPDGRLPYNSSECAVMREIKDGGATVVETVTRPGDAHSMPSVRTVRRLARRGKSLVYAAAEDGGAASGTVTFSSPELASWTFELRMASGARLKGTGEATREGYKTEGDLTGVARPMLVRDELKAVSPGSYRGRLPMMDAPKNAE